MANRQVHISRKRQDITESGIQLRSADPSASELVDGLEWYNTAEKLRKIYKNGNIINFAFEGETDGQSVYSTVVTNVSELSAAVSTGLATTIYLREGDYDLTGLASSLLVQKPLRLIGETKGRDSGERVRIITDTTHRIIVAPADTTLTTASTVAVTNNSVNVSRVSGTWSSTLTGKYLFVGGVPYKIATNPTTSTITLEERYSGPTSSSSSYFITSMIDYFTVENIDFYTSSSTNTELSLQNVNNATIKDCRFASARTTAGDYASLTGTILHNFKVSNCDFRNAVISLTSDVYNVNITDNDFVATVQTNSTYLINIDTAKGSSPISTLAKISRNTVTGPSTFVNLISAKSNIITNNIHKDANASSVILGANASNNVINNNIIETRAGSSTPISISGDRNTISNNVISKASGTSINLSSTAENNTVLGNVVIGSATINDTLPASNNNRIEDDFSRLGATTTGTDKDFIDKFNDILATLQNEPEVTRQQSVAVSGVVNESFVYWNTANNQYEQARSDMVSARATAGLAVDISGGSGDVLNFGIYNLTNTSNTKNADLFDNSYIGERFYLGTSGVVVPESEYETSIYKVDQVYNSVGVLIDVIGSSEAEFLLTPTQEYKYGTSSPTWRLGESDSSTKQIDFNSVYSDLDSIVYDPSDRAFYVVSNGQSGEITQPFNSSFMANSIHDYLQDSFTDLSTATFTVNPHVFYSDGIKYTDDSTSFITPTSYVGDVFILSHVDSGVILTTNTTNFSDSVLVGALYTSGSAFTTGSNAALSYKNGAIQATRTTDFDSSSTYEEIERVYVPVYASGVTDVSVTATVEGSVELTSGTPIQVANVAFSVDGSVISNSAYRTTYVYNEHLSGETIYNTLNVSRTLNLESSTQKLVKIALVGKSDVANPTPSITFSNANIEAKGL